MPDDLAEVSIATEVWTSKLANYLAETGKGVREGLYEEWPLLMRKVVDLTPPFKSGGAKGVSDLSIGRGAVERDVLKTMRPFDPRAIRSPALARVVARRDFAAFDVIAARSSDPHMKGALAIAFSPSVHTSARDARGRVPGRDRNRVVLGGDAALLAAYVKTVQNRVGYAKSGWLKALLLVGGEVPGYVARHGTSGGDVIDDHANEENPSITAINRTPWASRAGEGERIRASAFGSRAEAIAGKIRQKEREARQHAGFHG